ncbi:MAG: hypothetical protein KDI75_07195 [Xanthomonadales bacterium]|nr:hypothetical protein [Xanthomonadales bacterium]
MNQRLIFPILALAGLHSASAFGAEPPTAKVANGVSAFEMQRQVIAPGGGRSGNGAWQLDGTLGQVAAGRASGAAFTLDGGYWSPDVAAAGDTLFSDGFEDTP